MIGTIIARSKIRSAFKALNNHDINTFIADWRDDAVFIYPGDMSVSGEIKGKKAIQEWFKKYMEQYPQLKFTIKHICFSNIFDMTGTNHAAVEWDVSVKNRDGKEIQNSGVTTIQLKLAKAILIRDYYFDVDKLKEGWGEV